MLNVTASDHVFLVKIPYEAIKTGRGKERELVTYRMITTRTPIMRWWKHKKIKVTYERVPLPQAIRESLPENAVVLSIEPHPDNGVVRVYYTRQERSDTAPK